MLKMRINKIAVLGGGSWGTALAVLLANEGHDVFLWCRRREQADSLNKKRENLQYLPGVKLPRNVSVSHELGSISDAGMVIVSVPCAYFRKVLEDAKLLIKKEAVIVSASKGFEPKTSKRMSEIIKEITDSKNIAVLSGPNHAEEVGKGLPTATVVASSDMALAAEISKVFTADKFKAYPLTDVLGVEICGALKNITAIAVGICDNLHFGDNAKGAIITLGLKEMNEFGKAFGAKRSTCYGLAGVGDLITTCESEHSRNRFVGKRLAQSKKMEDISKEMKGMIAEGVETCKAAYEISRKKGIKMPLTAQVYQVLNEGKELKKAISNLLGSV